MAPLLGKKKPPFDLKRTGLLAWSVVRFIIVFGLAFIIVKPFIVKILMATMSPNDLLDNSVKLIPRNPSLYYWKEAWEGMQLEETFLLSLVMALAVGVIQLMASASIGYGLARFKFVGRGFAFAMVILILLIPAQTYSIAQYMGFRYFLGTDISLIDSGWPLFILSAVGLGTKEGLYIYLMMTFFKGLPVSLEEASYIDGANPIHTFFTIMLPNAKPILITVFLFSFCWQWTDSAYASMYFSSLKNIPSVIPGIYIRVGLTPDMLGSYITQNAACLIMLIPLIGLFMLGQKYLINSLASSGIAN